MFRLFSNILYGKANIQTFKCQDEAVFGCFLPQHKAVIAVTKTTIECFDSENLERKWCVIHTPENPVQPYTTTSSVLGFVSLPGISSKSTIHNCAIYNQDLNYLATGDEDGGIRVYEISTSPTGPIIKYKFLLGLSKPATPSTPEPADEADEQYVVPEEPKAPNPIIEESKKIMQEVLSDSINVGAVNCLLSITPDRLLSGCADGKTRLWSLTNQIPLATFSPVRKDKALTLSPVVALTYDELRMRVTAGHENGFIRQYDMYTGKKILELGNVQEKKAVLALSILIRPDFLVFSNENKMIRLWDLNADTQDQVYVGSATDMLYDLQQDMLFSSTDEGEVQLWKSVLSEKQDMNLQEKRDIERTVLPIRKQKIHSKRINHLWYHPDRDALVSSSQDKTVALWRDAVKITMDELDENTKSTLAKDFEMHVQDLNPDQTMNLINEMITKVPLPPYSLQSVPHEKNVTDLILSLLDPYPQIKAEVQQKVYTLLNKAENDSLQTMKFVETCRDNLCTKYSKFMTLEMQNAKALEDLEIKYEMDLNEMKERHARELKQLEQSYEHNKAQFIKDYKREVQRAAKSYQSIKNTYYRRMKSIDREISKHIKNAYTSFNICQDKNPQFASFNENYKLICPADPTQQIPASTTPNTKKESTLPTTTTSTVDLLTGNQIKVFKAVDMHQAKIVVVKLYPPLFNICETLVHDTLVPIHEIVYTDHYTFVVMETMKTNLRTFLTDNPVYYDRPKTASLIYTLLHALDYLDHNGMAHRDISPSNIFLNQENKPRLLHVGLMKGFKGEETRDGSEFYAAPEILGNTVINKSDIWSLGVVFAHLLQTPEERISQILFQGDTSDMLQQMINLTCDSNDQIETTKIYFAKPELLDKMKITEKQDLSKKICRANQDELDLLNRMLRFLPNKRETAEELLKHPYFKKHVPNIENFVF